MGSEHDSCMCYTDTHGILLDNHAKLKTDNANKKIITFFTLARRLSPELKKGGMCVYHLCLDP